MKTYIVLYYSKTGNSKFIASKLSHELACELKEITPIINNVLVLYLLSLWSINFPTNISGDEISKYDEVIIIGPIWGGKLISPLRTVLKKCKNASKNIHFAVTCETKEEDKNSKYGFAQVLKMASALGGKLVINTSAFSTSLVNSNNQPTTIKLSEKIKITDDNFMGTIKLRFEDFVKTIKST